MPADGGRCRGIAYLSVPTRATLRPDDVLDLALIGGRGVRLAASGLSARGELPAEWWSRGELLGEGAQLPSSSSLALSICSRVGPLEGRLAAGAALWIGSRKGSEGSRGWPLGAPHAPARLTCREVEEGRGG